MSNIRGLNDIRDTNNNNKFGNFSKITQTPNYLQTKPQKDPRDENYWDMIKLNLCPQLTFCSFSVIFSIILIIFFIVQLSVDGLTLEKNRFESEFLPINIKGNFTKNLTSDFTKIKNDYQIWRFLTSLFIHANFWHVLSNTLMIIIWMSYFEIFLSSKKMPIFFFLSGFLGNIFAVLINNGGTSLGASTGIFGIIGSSIGFIIFNWKNLDYENSPRNIWLCQIVFITIISFLFSSADSNFYAHLGGFIAGVFIGMFLSNRHLRPGGSISAYSTFEKIFIAIGIVLSLIFFVICFCLLMFK